MYWPQKQLLHALRTTAAQLAPALGDSCPVFGALGYQRNARNDGECDHSRRRVPAQLEATLRMRLVQEVTDGRAQRSGQNEGGPEESRSRYRCAEVEDRDEAYRGAKYDGPARIPQS